MRKIYTPEEIAQRFDIKVKRLIELVEQGFCPHIRVEDKIGFYLAETEEWIKENLIKEYQGKTIPVQLRFYESPLGIHPKQVPGELKILFSEDQLKKYEFSLFTPCIYFLCENGIIQYIGQSNFLPTRTYTHLKNGMNFNTVLYVEVPKSELDKIEKELIERFKPPLNRTWRKKLKLN